DGQYGGVGPRVLWVPPRLTASAVPTIITTRAARPTGPRFGSAHHIAMTPFPDTRSTTAPIARNAPTRTSCSPIGNSGDRPLRLIDPPVARRCERVPWPDALPRLRSAPRPGARLLVEPREAPGEPRAHRRRGHRHHDVGRHELHHRGSALPDPAGADQR